MAVRKEHVFRPPPVGHELHFTCDTHAGAKKMLSTGKKFLCFKCRTMETVVLVRNIVQHDRSVDYDCQLNCECFRWVSMAVARKPSDKKKLAESKAKAAKFKAEHQDGNGESEPIDDETAEVQAIHDEMREDGTLIESGEDTDSGDPKELQ